MIFRQQSGFTLIELMVTVAVLAVIAGIAIPVYSGYVQAGYKSECKNEVAAIKLAEEEYYLKYNNYFPTPGNPAAQTSLADAYGSNPIEIASGGTAGSSYSGGTYVSSYDSATKIAKANCTYSVSSSAAPPSYTITATGANQLASAGFTYTITK